MKARKWLRALLIVACAAFGAVGVACAPDEPTPPGPEEKVEGPETGVYYYDVDGAEWLITLHGGDKFALSGKGETKSGEYSLTDGALTLTFADASTLSASYADGVITLTYDGMQMRMLKKVTYTLTFDSKEGTPVASFSVLNGKTAAAPASPTREGYLFGGWYADADFDKPFLFDVDIVTSDMTLYARWIAKTGKAEVKVDFDLGYNGTAPDPVETIGGTVASLPAPERDGFEFAGWWVSMYDDATKLSYCYRENTVLAEDTTLHALWVDGNNRAPIVDVSSTAISWESVGVSTYSLTVEGPDGFETIEKSATSTLTEAIDFASAPAGDYTITVRAGDVSTQRYYKNKALARVSHFTVVDPSALVFDGVEGATHYYITVDCGNPAHTHDAIDIGANTYYNFINCEMKEGGIGFTVTAAGDGFASSTSRTFRYERTLPAVDTLIFDAANETLHWSPVPGAASYVVTVTHGTQKDVTDVGGATSFCLKHYPAGTLAIEIVPKTKGYLSPAAATYSYDKKTLPAPTDLKIVDRTLTWAAVSGADSYEVIINGVAHPASSTSFDLNTIDLVEAQDYLITVRALGTDSSLPSDPLDARYLALGATLDYGNGYVSWRSVIGAQAYEVRVNGGDAIRIDDGSDYASVLFDKTGDNLIEVRFFDGAHDSEWVSITVVAYEISFDSMGGDPVPSVYKAAGDAIGALPQDLTRPGYDFAGWYTVPGGAEKNGALFNDTYFNETRDIVLYANWESKEIEITYDYGDFAEDFADADQKSSALFGKNFTLSAPRLEGENAGAKEFAGWYTMPNGSGEKLTDENGVGLAAWNKTEPTTVYAYWADFFTFTHIDGGYSVSKGPGILLASGTLHVPATHENEPVLEIAAYAFQDCDRIETIELPSCIRLVETSTAFTGCLSLKAVNVYDAPTGSATGRYTASSDGVLIYDNPITDQTEIAFYPKARAGAYTIPDGVTTISLNVFSQSQIEKVTIPYTVTNIEASAFYNCRVLTDVIFSPAPDGEVAGTLTIGDEAFRYCYTLANLTLPARLGDHGTDFYAHNFFETCEALQNLDIEEGNEFYTSVDGLLLNKAGDTILFSPVGRTSVDFKQSGLRDVRTIGKNAFRRNILLTELVIPSTITLIDESAFELCSGLVSVMFDGGGDTVSPVTLGTRAFASCSRLTTIEFADDTMLSSFGDYAFANCRSLTEIVFPKTLASVGANAFDSCYDLQRVVFGTTNADFTIGANAFRDCRSLRTVELSATARNIQTSIFSGCTNLEEIIVDPGNESYFAEGGILYERLEEGDALRLMFYPNARTGDVEINDKVTQIDGGVFSRNENVRKVIFNANLTSIGASAFSGCKNLSEIVFTAGGDVDLVIGNNAFNGTALKTVEIPASATQIGDNAFANCGQLTSVTFAPDGKLTSIGASAFTNTKLSSVVIPKTVTTLGASAFYGLNTLTDVAFEDGGTEPLTITGGSGMQNGAFANSQNLAKVHLPARIQAIGNYTFYNCYALATLEFENADAPEELTASIGDRAFENTNLTALALPKHFSGIGQYAFNNCDQLTSVTFAAGSLVTTIANYAFNNCPALITLTLPEEIASIGNYAFAYSGIKELVIPETVNYIGTNAFYHTPITSLTFTGAAAASLAREAATTLTIGASAFEGCEALASVTLPARLSTFDGTAFKDCTALTAIEIQDGCTSYHSVNGMVVSGTGTLLVCPAGKTGTVEISNQIATIGKTAFSGCALITEITFQEGAGQTLTIENGTYSGGAFSGCTQLKSITLPAHLGEIGSYAFAGSTNLTAVNFPASSGTLKTIGSHAFEGTGLTALTIPAYVTTINENAFASCANLASITITDGTESLTVGKDAFNGAKITQIVIPARVGSLGEGVFRNCTDLMTVTFNTRTSNLQLGSNVFENTKVNAVSLPEGSTEIGASAFKNSELTSITIPSTVTRIGNNAFEGSALQSIEIPLGVTEIGASAFKNCEALTSVTFTQGERTGSMTIANEAFLGTAISKITLPANVTEIGDYAFKDCKQLTEVALSEQLNKISVEPVGYSTTFNSTFEGCDALATLTIPEANTTYKTVENVLYSEDGTKILYYPTARAGESFSMPNDVTTMQVAMFRYAKNLKTVVLSDHLTEIKNDAFRGNTTITSVTIPASVTTIGTYAFDGCTSLVTVTQPGGTTGNLNMIGQNAFNNCSALKAFTLPGTIGTIGQNAFQNCTDLTDLTQAETASITKIDNYAFAGAGITHFNVWSTIKTIGTYAFKGSALESVTFKTGFSGTFMPNGQGILSGAFQDCAELTEVEFETGARITNYNATYNNTSSPAPFSGCMNLKSITLPEGSTSFQGGGSNPNFMSVFGNSGIEEITFPDSFTSLGTAAFANMTKLKTIHAPNGFTKASSLPQGCFFNCSSLETVDMPSIFKPTSPSGYSSAGNYMFSGCTSLRSITLPKFSSATALNSTNGFLAGCTSLTEITLPDNISAFGPYMFDGCTSLRTVNYNNTLSNSNIGNYAFRGCKALTSFNLPTTPGYYGIGQYAFAESGLQSITIPCAWGNLQAHAFDGCTDLVSVTFEEGTSTQTARVIGNYAFAGCTSLTSVRLKSDWLVIEQYVFQGCTELSEINLPETLTTINNFAFDGCSSLTDVTLPASLTTIGQAAFRNTGITSVELAPAGNLSVGLYAFRGTPVTTISISGNVIFNNAVFAECEELGELILTNSGDNTITLGRGMFSGCSNLETVELRGKFALNANLFAEDTEGQETFSACTHLASVTLTGEITVGNNVFDGCSALIALNLSGVTSIGDYAFRNTGLTRVSLPSSLTHIGAGAFYGTKVTFDVSNNTEFTVDSDGVLFSADSTTLYSYPSDRASAYVIPDSVTTIADGAFAGSEITALTIGSGLTAIPAGAFQGCLKLAVVNFSAESALTSIGANAFNGCTALTTVNGLPGSVTSIGDNAFNGCAILRSIDLPEGLTTLGASAFAGTAALASDITFGSSLTTISASAFAGSGITGVTLGSGVTTIGNSAFDGCESLATFDLTGSVLASVGTYAFRDCKLLTSFEVPETLTGLAEGLFMGSGLTSFVIPETVNKNSSYPNLFRDCVDLVTVEWLSSSTWSIGNYAFAGCTSLTTVTILNTTTLSEHAFEGCTSLNSLTVPNAYYFYAYSLAGCTGFEEITIARSVGSRDVNLYANVFDGWQQNQRIILADRSESEGKPSGWNDNWRANCAAEIIWGLDN